MFKDIELSSNANAAMSAAIAALSYQVNSPPRCCSPCTCPAAALTWHLPHCCCPLQEGMFKDIELSSDVMAAFRQAAHYRSKLPPGVDMSVSVLTSGFWPTYPITEAKLPQV